MSSTALTWRQVPAREIAKEIVGGSTPSRDVHSLWNGGIPWVTPGELTKLGGKFLYETAETISKAGLANSGAKLLPADALIVTTRATLGLVALTTGPMTTNQGFKSIVFSGEADPNFYYHLFKTLKPEMERRASGTTFLEISGKQFGDIVVPLPPLPEQRWIAEILDTLDDQIRTTEQIISKLNRAMRGLLNDLLTRGICGGELRDPMHHRQQFRDSALGLVPAGWAVGPLAEFLDHTDYGISTSLKRSGRVPVLRMNNIVDGEVDTSDLKYSDSPGARSLLLRGGDVLFNRTNSIEHVGRTGIWRGQLLVCSFASYLVRLVPGGLLRNEYLNRILSLPSQQRALRQWATPGVHQVNVNPTNLGRLIIAVPNTLEEQDAICAILSQHDSVIRRETSEVIKLRALKSAMASDLLTGRVRITAMAAL